MALNDDEKADRRKKNLKKLYDKQYYKNNKGKICKQVRKYDQDNKEKICKQKKQYYQDNKKKIKQRYKQYYQDNKKKINIASKKWIKDNPTGAKKIRKMSNKRYYKDNKEKIKQRSKKYLQSPLGKEKRKQYKQNNKEKINKTQKLYLRKKRKTDSIFAIRERLRGRLKSALRVYSKNGKVKTSDEYGINYKAIINHLRPFPRDKHLYHVDHKKPLSSFNFNDPEQIKLAFAPENHQWLLIKENLSKGTKIEAQSTLL